jgi:hypothetical protein
MLTRMLVVIAFLACNSNAESLQPSLSRQSWQDLEVITLDSQGNPAKTVFYGYDQLLTLPTVTVMSRVGMKPATNGRNDPASEFGADASLDVIGANYLWSLASGTPVA